MSRKIKRKKVSRKVKRKKVTRQVKRKSEYESEAQKKVSTKVRHNKR